MKKEQKTLSMFDQMLKYAAEQRMDEMACEVLTGQELSLHTFSSDFDKRMNAYFKKVKRKDFYRHTRRALARVAIVLFAVIAVSTTVVLSVDAFRVPALKFFTHTNEDAVSVMIRDESGIYNSCKEEISGLYLPNYLPEGFKVDAIERAGSIYSAHYTNDKGEFIILQHFVEGSAAAIDNEDAVEEDVIVKDQPAQIYMKNGTISLLFTYQKNVFLLTGYINKEEAIRMAESLYYNK